MPRKPKTQDTATRATSSPPESGHAELLVQPMSLDTGFSSAAPGTMAKAGEAFDHLGAVVRDSVSKFWQRISESELNNPAEIELAFQVGLEAGGNWVVVSGKGTATASIKLKWSNKRETGVKEDS